MTRYRIMRQLDRLWWTGDGWSDKRVKTFVSAAQAGTALALLPGNLEQKVYKLVPVYEKLETRVGNGETQVGRTE